MEVKQALMSNSTLQVNTQLAFSFRHAFMLANASLFVQIAHMEHATLLQKWIAAMHTSAATAPCLFSLDWQACPVPNSKACIAHEPHSSCCAVANNLTVIRMFAFPVVDGFNLETEPGVYNESMFQAFDYVVAKAGQLGLKLLPSLANNWEYNNNMTQTK